MHPRLYDIILLFLAWIKVYPFLLFPSLSVKVALAALHIQQHIMYDWWDPLESPKVRGFLVSCNILIVIMAQTPFLPNLYKSICIHSNCHCNPQDSSRHGLLSYRCISTHQWLREFSTKLNFRCFDKNMASHFFIRKEFDL